MSLSRAKYFYRFLLAAAFGFLLASCGAKDSKSVLQEAVDREAAKCPLALDPGVVLMGISYDPEANDVTLSHAVNVAEADGTMRLLRYKELFPAQTSRYFANFLNNENSRDLLLKLAAAGASLKSDYKLDSGEELTLCVSPQDIQEAAGKARRNESNDKEMLEFFVLADNSELPLTLEDGVSIRSLELTPEKLVFNIEVDENEWNMDALNEDEVKTLVKENLRRDFQTTPFMANYKQRLKNTGRSEQFRYYGTASGKEVFIIFDNEEL